MCTAQVSQSHYHTGDYDNRLFLLALLDYVSRAHEIAICLSSVVSMVLTKLCLGFLKIEILMNFIRFR